MLFDGSRPATDSGARALTAEPKLRPTRREGTRSCERL
jgi:hypothetical protein